MPKGPRKNSIFSLLRGTAFHCDLGDATPTIFNLINCTRILDSFEENWETSLFCPAVNWQYFRRKYCRYWPLINLFYSGLFGGSKGSLLRPYMEIMPLMTPHHEVLFYNSTSPEMLRKWHMCRKATFNAFMFVEREMFLSHLYPPNLFDSTVALL